jgi:hypothetical protein
MVKYICVQPRLVYYAWQLEVMLNNFIKNGVNSFDIYILMAYSPNQQDLTNHPDVVELYNKLMKRFSGVNFLYYKDTREYPQYISSVRPNILKQHFAKYPELISSTIFYHDCDIIFTKTPDFSEFLNDNYWYLSNTNSYINSSYIRSKGEDIYNDMCRIVGIDSKIPKIMDNDSGGAQYLMKGVDSKFWEKVEHDSELLYSYFLDIESKKISEDPGYHPIQKWTSDMWAVLWNAWYFEHPTRVHSYFDFTWATDHISKWDKNLIYHNAGVVESGPCFYKGNHINTLPYNLENIYSPILASYKYFEEILEAKSKSLFI